MIDSIKQYLLTVITAAIISSFVNSLAGKAGSAGKIIRLLSGVVLTLCVVSPILSLNFSEVRDYIDAFSYDSAETVSVGTEYTDTALRQSIKQQSEAYILEKAASMNVELTVEVTLSEDSPPVPKDVALTGSISPYAKSRLSELIADDLGITKEHQLWT